MVEWFNERYISRDEHQQVVGYYTKLVAQLYRQVCDLRAGQPAAHAPSIGDIVKHDEREADVRVRGPVGVPPVEAAGNVIRVDFRRPR